MITFEIIEDQKFPMESKSFQDKILKLIKLKRYSKVIIHKGCGGLVKPYLKEFLTETVYKCIKCKAHLAMIAFLDREKIEYVWMKNSVLNKLKVIEEL